MPEFIDTPIYLLILIIINFLVIVMGIALTFFHNYRYTFFTKKEKLLDLRFNQIIARTILFKKNINDELINTINSIGQLKKEKVRNILIKNLEVYLNFLESEESNLVIELYRRLNLSTEPKKMLYSHSRSKIRRALYELINFHVPVDRNRILQLQQSKHKTLREKANVYTLQMFHSNIYEFLDYPGQKLTKWEQLKYFQLINKRTILKKPKYRKWVSEKYHPSIVSLALDFVSYYYQVDALSNIYDLIPRADKLLRKKLINTIGKLRQTDSMCFLINWYDYEKSTTCRIEIIKSLGYIAYNDVFVIDFLNKLFEENKNLNVKKAIVIAQSRLKNTTNIPIIEIKEKEFDKVYT